MKLPKNPLWPVQGWWRFADDSDDDGGDDGGGGGEPVVKDDKKAVVKPLAHWVGEDKDLQGYVDKKGYKDAASVVKAYRDWEKKQGAMVTLPGVDAKDEDWAKFADKLRPRNAGEYAIGKLDLPDGARDDAIEAAMDAYAHEQGWPAKWWKAAKTRLFETYGKQIADLDTEATRIKAEDEKTMRLKWGQDYDGNIAMSDRAMQKMGVKELLKQFGIDTHPLVQVAFAQMSGFLEEMKPPDGKGGSEEESKSKWFTDYSEIKKKTE